VTAISKLSGVSSAAGGLMLNAIHVEGTVPQQQQQNGGTFRGPSAGGGQGPRSIDLNSRSVSGVDTAHKGLGAITPSQITKGRFLAGGTTYEAVLDVSYARGQNLGVGDTVKLGGKTFSVVGLAKTPLGGQSSDLYVDLTQLQRLSNRVGRVNTIYVRASKSSQVGAISRHIQTAFPGASVTTAKDLADRVSGSLVDAKSLTKKLGTALEIVGLLAAFLIASLLALSSVAKRIRELGTLKALGWPQRLVVRQVTGESLLQGLLGGALGIALGLAGAALVSALSPTLKATFAAATSQGPLIGPFGQGSVPSGGSTSVALTAPVSLGLAALAVALAVAGGLLAGAVGGLRAARLRPADALRHLD